MSENVRNVRMSECPRGTFSSPANTRIPLADKKKNDRKITRRAARRAEPSRAEPAGALDHRRKVPIGPGRCACMHLRAK
jgi:hypothetical protein